MSKRVIDRLIQFLNYRKISAYSFGRVCQVANGYLKKQEKGKGSIGSDIIERIHRSYPALNLVWLLTGKGNMLSSSQEDNAPLLREDIVPYSLEETIISLKERIASLESAIRDKEKIIQLLESRSR